jgi:uncharacterized protein (TIGR00369 family)
VETDPKCQESFDRQGFMQLLGAELLEAANGRAVIEVPYRSDLTQQHGYLHGGVVSAIADTASGYAAYTSMPADASVLTIEFKINPLNPAAGERFRAEATVHKAGRTLVVVGATVTAIRGEDAVVCAEMLGTFIVLRNTSDVEPKKR